VEARLKRWQAQVDQPRGFADSQSPPNGPSFLWVAPWWALGLVLDVRASSGGPFDLCALS
jgi:hypothetical protein